MTQPGYQENGEPTWWWKVAQHLDAAHLASVNAMVHNVDSQEQVFAFQDKIREAQAILYKIFQDKGLLPVDHAPNGSNGSNGSAPSPESGGGVSASPPGQEAPQLSSDPPSPESEGGVSVAVAPPVEPPAEPPVSEI
jgi:hypothetical protein